MNVHSPAGREWRTPLTPREQTVLALMAEGLSAAAIARRLGISPRTITKHQENLYRKLDTSDRLSAVLRGMALGVLPYPRPGEPPWTAP